MGVVVYMSFAKKIVLLAAGFLMIAWGVGNYGRLAGDEEGIIRFVLGLFFAIFILLRWKERDVVAKIPDWVLPVVGGLGALMALYGIIFRVHQFEWLGLIFVMYACLRWALPVRFGSDVILSLFMLYWVHPLPGQIFGQFQIIMQLISVKISEWVLHGFNVRVWADGMVLYTNGTTFGVPESCSGMRTAVTVVLCTLGAGILLRFKWWQLLSFLVFSVVQVLAFNVLRISGMVYLAPRMPPEWAQDFLHDTLGIFLFMSIIIIQMEMSWYKYWYDKRLRQKSGILHGELEPPDLGSVLPKFWRFLARKGSFVILGLAVILLVVFAVIKSRPSHRNEMVREVISGLTERDPELAARAIEQVLAYDPGDKEMQIEQIRILLKQKRYEEVLVKIDAIDGELELVQVVWKSWALMALDRMDEAVANLSDLPENVKKLPGIAIVNAEFAARKDAAEDVSRNIVLAAKWTALSPRVRDLFPYLAAREQWAAIVACNSDVPFDEITHALIAVSANLRERNILGAERELRVALKCWPEDARFLGYITKVALSRPGKGWEDKMAANFKANLMGLSKDVVAEYLGNCFKLRRPDLGWLAYLHLLQKDADDPALSLAVVQFGKDWFKFLRKDIEVPVDDGEELLDLRAFYRLTETVEPFKSFWNEIPLNLELVNDDIEQFRSASLVKCLMELKKRNDTGLLNFRMQIMYPFVLALDNKYDEAHKMLDALLLQYPEKKSDLLLRQATLYTREQRWGEVYETLRAYNMIAGEITLNAVLQNINAMIHLDMGISAIQFVKDAEDIFPGAPQLALSEVALWSMFGFSEDAFFVLDKAGLVSVAAISPQLLYDIGRFKEADKLSKVWGMRLAKRGIEKNTRLHFVPAELVVSDKWPKPLSEKQMKNRAETMVTIQENAYSPFVKKLSKLTAKWYEMNGQSQNGNIKEWEVVGRDKYEKCDALHRLAILNIQQGNYPAAKQVLLKAINYIPCSPVLRRLQIRLEKGARETVKAARVACPDDSAIWLSDVVMSMSNGTTDVASKMVIDAATNSAYSVRDVVRAGYLMYRNNLIKPAMAAAEYGIKAGYGVLPPYVLGTLCALKEKNWSVAMNMAVNGADIAPDPSIFYKTIVQVKAAQKTSDSELINALEFLRSNNKGDNDSLWIENLGFVYFKNKDMKRALSVLSPIIDKNIKAVRTDSLVLAAEAARQQGEDKLAINIIDAANKLHPDNISVLNNLVYYLAMNPATVDRARRHVQELIDSGKESFEIFDTVAMVYLYSGDLKLAKEYMDKAISIVPADDPRVLEIRLNMARILYKSGELKKAKDILDEVGKNRDRSFIVDTKSKIMLKEIEKAIKESKRLQ